MDSERQLRSQFVRALDEVVPAVPWLEDTVLQDLRRHQSGRVGAHAALGRTTPRLSRRQTRLIAAALAVVLAVAGVAAFVGLHRVEPHNVPVGAKSIKAYQQLVAKDYAAWSATDGGLCLSLGQAGCPAARAPIVASLQRWLDDLNRTEPPARFVVIDAQFRHHLADYIAGLQAWATFYQGRDQALVDQEQGAFGLDIQWLNALSGTIFRSQQGTAVAYVQSVRTETQNLASCGFCQLLSGEDPFACTGDQIASCQVYLEYASAGVSKFQGALVQIAAPGALADRDSNLQNDLAHADSALIAMAGASVAGDQAGFDAGRVAFRKALIAVNADVGGVLGA